MRSLYHPGTNTPFKLSRSKIDLFLECPRCFYLDRRLGISRPSIPAFTLNSAVDFLLKKEFDLLRKDSQPHELMKKYNIDAVPFRHSELDIWRNNFRGKTYHHPLTNLIITGAIDDLWQDSEGNLLIVEYKATSTRSEISLNDKYKRGFKRQIEVYQWIFRKSNFPVSDTGYFVYANASKNRPTFDSILEFELSIISYQGDDSWVEPTIIQIKECLDSDEIPDPGEECEYCVYHQAVSSSLRDEGK
jgi:hypothetical protein